MPSKILTESADKNITESRKVLYDQSANQADYVKCYEDYWAHSYNADGEDLGFQAWTYATEMIKKFVPNKEALILDYCGGTGQVGKRLAAAGYKNLHHSDGSTNMQKQAKALGVYSKFFTQVVNRGEHAEYLKGETKYDVVLSSMSLSEFQAFVQQVFDEALKPGGIFIAIESLPHVESCGLDGITWALEEAKKPNSGIELLEDDEEKPHDEFTDHPTKIVVFRKKF